MSPSVYNSTRVLLSTANQDLRMLHKPEITKVKRALFGPVDPKATQKFIDNELKKIIVTKSEKWNFNFQTESNLKPEGLFDWRPATPRKQDFQRTRIESIDVKIANQYFDIAEADIIRPRPITCTSPTERMMEHRVQQRRITDFMKATKRSLPFDVSKTKPQSSSDWNMEIPNKLPRLDIAS